MRRKHLDTLSSEIERGKNPHVFYSYSRQALLALRNSQPSTQLLNTVTQNLQGLNLTGNTHKP